MISGGTKVPDDSVGDGPGRAPGRAAAAHRAGPVTGLPIPLPLPVSGPGAGQDLKHLNPGPSASEHDAAARPPDSETQAVRVPAGSRRRRKLAIYVTWTPETLTGTVSP
jgi:hypothetical protein